MSNRNYYINGNAVEKQEVQPVRRKQTPQETEELRRKKNRKNAARRNRERALYMSGSYVAFLSCCVALAAFSAVIYVNLQSSVSHRMSQIASIESQITDLKADNDAKYKRITTSVDLNEIKDIAINQLGMQYPTEGQVVYYTVDNNNFMDQYNDIPAK